MIWALSLLFSLPVLALKQCAPQYYCPEKQKLNNENVFDFHCVASNDPVLPFFCCQGYERAVLCGRRCCPYGYICKDTSCQLDLDQVPFASKLQKYVLKSRVGGQVVALVEAKQAFPAYFRKDDPGRESLLQVVQSLLLVIHQDKAGQVYSDSIPDSALPAQTAIHNSMQNCLSRVSRPTSSKNYTQMIKHLLGNQFSTDESIVKTQLDMTIEIVQSHLDPDILFCLEQEQQPLLARLAANINETVLFLSENAGQVNGIMGNAQELFESGFPQEAGRQLGRVAVEVAHYVS